MSEFDQPRVVLLTWEGIDAVIADEWDSMPPALRSACHSLREYTRELPRLIDEKNAAVEALATLQRSADEGERTRELMAREYSDLCEYLGVVPDVAVAVISTLRSRERERQRSADEMREALERIANFAPGYGEVAEQIAQMARHALYPELAEMARAEAALKALPPQEKAE
jgi:hypothetical protein